MQNDDYKHANELGDLKDTKYWFKRDIDTIKKSLGKTTKISPVLLIVALAISLSINYSNNTLSANLILVATLLIFLVTVLGYFLVHMLVAKGYNVSRSGTVIDSSRNPLSDADLERRD